MYRSPRGPSRCDRSKARPTCCQALTASCQRQRPALAPRPRTQSANRDHFWAILLAAADGALLASAITEGRMQRTNRNTISAGIIAAMLLQEPARSHGPNPSCRARISMERRVRHRLGQQHQRQHQLERDRDAQRPGRGHHQESLRRRLQHRASSSGSAADTCSVPSRRCGSPLRFSRSTPT